MHPIQQLRMRRAAPVPRPNHQPMQAAHAAPRCEHIRDNGRRCAAPARRGQPLCYFHHRATDPATYNERWFPVVQDATTLQLAIARVQRLLLMDGFEFKRATALLYSLQIACMNLKNFQAENPHLTPAQDQPPELEAAAAEEVMGEARTLTATERVLGVSFKPPQLPEDPEDLYNVGLREGMDGVRARLAKLGKAPASAAKPEEKPEEKAGGNGNGVPPLAKPAKGGAPKDAPPAAPAQSSNSLLEPPRPGLENNYRELLRRQRRAAAGAPLVSR